jgi:S-sulfosulfanyl-L-cysteine sulfohydrolase
MNEVNIKEAIMKRWARSIAMTCILSASAAYIPAALADDEIEIKIIHMGDVHGHLIPRPNVRSDGNGRMEGGLARMYTKIGRIRGDGKKSLLINTGDTIQGSAEALYTKGQALVDVVNLFNIDVFAPGNWEFVYGTERFRELFAGVNGAEPLAPWNSVAANVYYDGIANPAYAALDGQPVLPKYKIIIKNGVRIGVLGFTTDRGPQVVGSAVTKGFRFLNSAPGSAGIAGSDISQVEQELQARIAELRPQVDLLVVASELGLSNNMLLAERNAGIDVILSSDMHEETRQPVVASTGTIVVEEGQDGTMIGELKFEFTKNSDGKLAVKTWEWKAHTINDIIVENSAIKSKINSVRAPFLDSVAAQTYVNPFSGTKLSGPIDEVVGYTEVPLHRSNFSAENMPALVEGSSHDFLTDAFRAIGISRFGADIDAGTRPVNVIAAIRGFRYGTHVNKGPIKREDLYHFLAIGPKIACATIEGGKVKNQMENAADGSLNPDPRRWTGGWLYNFSGLTSDLYPITGASYDPLTGATVGALNRVRNINIQSKYGNWSAWSAANAYTYCSYYYDVDPFQVNKVDISTVYRPTIQIIRDENGNAMDSVDVVIEYLKSLPGQTANPVLNRTTIKEPLPAYLTGNPEMQPWSGAY